MSASYSWEDKDRLGRRLAKLADPDLRALMDDCRAIIVEGNRKGVLSGIDKDGGYMVATKYRNSIVRKARARTGAAFGQVAGAFGGFGPMAAGLHNNLTTAEYRKLTGPPLAPRGEFSRVITNLVHRHGREGGVWFAEAEWADVVDVKGRPFLEAHFLGKGRLPIRNLAGIRPADRKLIERAIRLEIDAITRTP